MIEKYYSEILNKYFDNKKDCLEAELAEKKRVEKVAELQKNKVARKTQIAEAYKHYMDLRDAFVEDYGELNFLYSKVGDGEPKVDFTDLKGIFDDWDKLLK